MGPITRDRQPFILMATRKVWFSVGSGAATPVDVSTGITVGEFKKLVKAKKAPELDYIAADRLTVSCVLLWVLTSI